MKLLLLSVGTRGDMEPFLAIGQGLEARGHEVVCALPEQFRELADRAGLEFVSLGPEFLELLDSDLGRTALGGGGSAAAQLAANIRLAGRQTDANRDLAVRQHAIIERERPDRILYNGKAIVPVLWEADHPGRSVLISPVPYLHYVEGHTHVAFHTDLGASLNRLTYAIADFGQAVTARISARWLGLPDPPSLRRLRAVVRHRRAVYTISPTLFPRPDHWPDNVRVLGYQERAGPREGGLDPSLREFLDRHADAGVLFVTFGSMTSPDPERRTRALLDVVVRNRIPTIINIAAGGLVRPAAGSGEGPDPGLVRFVGKVPYPAIFPRVRAVVHHGGSGTTHGALRAGRPTLVVPHIIDQFAWSRIVEGLGVGPAGLPIGRFTASRLEPRILDLVVNPAYRAAARRVAERMAAEHLDDELYAALTS